MKILQITIQFYFHPLYTLTIFSAEILSDINNLTNTFIRPFNHYNFSSVINLTNTFIRPFNHYNFSSVVDLRSSQLSAHLVNSAHTCTDDR